MHRSFMWFLLLNWCESTFYSVTAAEDFKCKQLLTYYDITVMSQWLIFPMWFLWTLCYQNIVEVSELKEFVKYTFVPRFIIERICGAMNCLVSNDIINCPKATRTAWINILIILQWWGSMGTMHGFSTELIRNQAIWLVESRSYISKFADHDRI